MSKLTTTEFNKIKKLLEEFSTKEIIDNNLSDKKHTTINCIKRSNSFEEYKILSQAHYKKVKPQEKLEEITGTTLVLKRCIQKNIAYNNFVYPKVGSIVEATDWKSTNKCGNGLHGWTENYWTYYDSNLKGNWVVLEVNKADGFVEMEDKVKFRKGTVLYNGKDLEQAKKLILKEQPNFVFHFDTQKAGDGSAQTAGYCSTQTAGYCSTQTASDCSAQTAGDDSTQTASYCSTQTAGHTSTQTASDCSAQTARDGSTQTAGDDSTQTAGYRSTQTASDCSAQTAGDDSTQKAGYDSTQKAGINATQKANSYSTQTAGGYSAQTAGYRSAQTAGYCSTQKAGHTSTQTAGDDSTQTAGYRSAQTAGYCSTQTAGYRSAQTAGYRSAQTAGYCSTQKAGFYSFINNYVYYDNYNIVRPSRCSVVSSINIPSGIARSFVSNQGGITYVINSSCEIEKKYTTTPDAIRQLEDFEIIVFGSNLNGNHAGGLAKLCADKFGAEGGIGEGETSQCYAFPTLDENMNKVSGQALEQSVQKLIEFANNNTGKIILLTKVGCGIAGFNEDEIKGYFKDLPANIIKPKGW